MDIEQQIQEMRINLLATRHTLVQQLGRYEASIAKLDSFGGKATTKTPHNKHRMNKVGSGPSIKERILTALSTGDKTRAELGTIVVCNPRSMDTILCELKSTGRVSSTKNDSQINIYKKVG